MTSRRSAEDASSHLPELLEAAERGQTTVITKRGRPVAVLAPFKSPESAERQNSLLSLEGSGRGLWGEDSPTALRVLRDEWNR